MPVGAVLCGGRSSRMGRDKAFVEVDGVPMARRVADALADAGCDSVEAVGGDAPGLAALGLVTVPDGWPGEGPVGGVLTALEHWPDADAVVVVACDLPHLTAHTIRALVAALAAAPGALAGVAFTDRVEPLCVGWRPAASVSLRAALEAGERRLHVVLATLPIVTVPVDLQDLANVNAPSDLGTNL
jgi:molybdopterin-guanine dinucleotide biosynthesis protein A